MLSSPTAPSSAPPEPPNPTAPDDSDRFPPIPRHIFEAFAAFRLDEDAEPIQVPLFVPPKDIPPIPPEGEPRVKKDLWEFLKERAAERKKTEEGGITVGGSVPRAIDALTGGTHPTERIETTLMFLGQRGAGKTSIILKFLNRTDTPQKTIALDYTYGRRTRGSVKDIVHIYELARGTSLIRGIDIAVKERNLHTTSFALVVDLSDPHTLLSTILPLLDRARQRVTSLAEGLEKRGSRRPKNLRQHALKKYDGHEDKSLVTPLLVPLIILGNKYDQFSQMEASHRRLITHTLRHLAHTNGAVLCYMTLRDDQVASRCRHLLSHFSFKTPPPKGETMEDGKALYVLPGTDSYTSIGLPQSAGLAGLGDASSSLAKDPSAVWGRWRAEFERVFPPKIGVIRSAIPGEQWANDVLSTELELLPPPPPLPTKDKEAFRKFLRGEGPPGPWATGKGVSSSESGRSGMEYSRARAAGMGVLGKQW
ncbi:hypothetical protein M427DRAFT_491621 [Gonapodya prolifera JEL478]|uniref:Cytoplasmic dynein 2 light intermediate chain 1 n=1 Tax=Gonapodya prolifera (strain JEL478) TaxID=1344416 RepID=A0A139AM47_GONPJ|nr:hypothetical protein M427DRAFT_491621 [Gonapodya prolifera JEL478]|eukprot:KXS17768.1 hypothetical protein M427DRAFT_491621 [Gonapodya prolifera JEL478]